MPDVANFASFQTELARLVEKFDRNLKELKSPGYDEAKLRLEYLDPLFRALGWDMENRAGLIQQKREVEIESRTQIEGRQKRADYLFRTDGRDRFVCEAKKPAEELHSRYAFQAKRYAWNKDLPLAVLTDFEELKIFIVGGRPHADEPDVGLWKTWHFLEFPLLAQELWNLLAREKVAAASIDQLIESLPKKPTGKGKVRQQWLIKPDRSRALDVDFLNFLDEARRELASDLIRHNDRDDLLEGTKLNEAVQRTLDRLLFLRICEDRDVDTGIRLDSIVETWRRNNDKEDGRRAHQKPLELREEPRAHYGYVGIRAPKDSLWRVIVRHFRALDRRPPSHVPFFNGNLFKYHESEELLVSDEWLADFIGELSDEESPYLFNLIPVEILGTIYERFLGKTVRPKGRGTEIIEKPEVRKAGGVYYTPRYIVEYIVEQTVGKLLEGRKPEQTLKLRFLDPACGSGSFLIRAFERVCEHWQHWLSRHPNDRKKKWCWQDPVTKDLHLTVALKHQILRNNIHGVDIDLGAVEVTQLSLYLKMLENENRTTLQRQRALLPDDDDPLLPPLDANIKQGNSLIASDFSMMPEDLVRVHAFDWNVGFRDIMKAGGFDAVIGNPPYLYSAGQESIAYFNERYRFSEYQTDFYTYFIEKALSLVKRQGKFSFIVSDSWMKAENFSKLRNHLLSEHRLLRLAVFDFPPFEGATIENSVLVVSRGEKPCSIPMDRFTEPEKFHLQSEVEPHKSIERGLIDPRYSEESLRLIEKLERGSVPLESLVELNRGIHAYRTDGYGKTRFGNLTALSLPLGVAPRVIRLHALFQPPGVETLRQLDQFLDAHTEAERLQQESRRQEPSPPKTLLSRHELVKRKAESKRLDRVLIAAMLAKEGMDILRSEALNGDSEAIQTLAKQTMNATMVLHLVELAYPALAKEAARGQIAWPVLAGREKGWEVKAVRRVAGLDVGGGFPMFRVKFRTVKGADENYPARVWAKEAVRTLEETRWRFVAFHDSRVGFTALISDHGWDLQPSPEWAKLAATLPLLTRDTVPKWAEVIRMMIRDQVKDFHNRPEWSNQRNTARIRGRDTPGEIQNAILDDIVSALRLLAPIKEMPKSAC